jgi:hypothetical protein
MMATTMKITTDFNIVYHNRGPISGPTRIPNRDEPPGHHLQSKYVLSLTNVVCMIKKMNGPKNERIIATQTEANVFQVQSTVCWIQFHE